MSIDDTARGGAAAPLLDRFFGDVADDERLEEDNADFWRALIARIVEDGPDASVRAVVDVGCHRGGLLERLARRWSPEELYGIEPIEAAREHASRRLRDLRAEVRLVTPEESRQIPPRRIHLVTCHEVLYLVEDLAPLMEAVARWLAPGGRAYFVLGCHSENPVWPIWKPKLEAAGHVVFDHRPLDILAAGARAGLVPGLRPLRDHGWIQYNPDASAFPFPSAQALIEHHYRYKLLFRFVRP